MIEDPERGIILPKTTGVHFGDRRTGLSFTGFGNVVSLGALFFSGSPRAGINPEDTSTEGVIDRVIAKGIDQRGKLKFIEIDRDGTIFIATTDGMKIESIPIKDLRDVKIEIGKGVIGGFPPNDALSEKFTTEEIIAVIETPLYNEQGASKLPYNQVLLAFNTMVSLGPFTKGKKSPVG